MERNNGEIGVRLVGIISDLNVHRLVYGDLVHVNVRRSLGLLEIRLIKHARLTCCIESAERDGVFCKSYLAGQLVLDTELAPKVVHLVTQVSPNFILMRHDIFHFER